jgi:hypothetical protein
MAAPERCAELARTALALGTDDHGASAEPADRIPGLKTDVSDLLANLRHLCDQERLDYAELDTDAYDHYAVDASGAASDRLPPVSHPRVVTRAAIVEVLADRSSAADVVQWLTESLRTDDDEFARA